MSEAIATMEHVRAAGFCARGARAFVARHGLDWEALRKNGMPVSELYRTGDALACKVADAAVAAGEQQEADHGQK